MSLLPVHGGPTDPGPRYPWCFLFDNKMCAVAVLLGSGVAAVLWGCSSAVVVVVVLLTRPAPH